MPICPYGQIFTMYIPLSTSDGWPRGIYGSINLKKFMKPSFDQPKNISEDWTRNQKKNCIRLLCIVVLLHIVFGIVLHISWLVLCVSIICYRHLLTHTLSSISILHQKTEKQYFLKALSINTKVRIGMIFTQFLR